MRTDKDNYGTSKKGRKQNEVKDKEFNKQTFLPYKFQYNYDSNCAIYMSKNVSKNCNLTDEDFEL